MLLNRCSNYNAVRTVVLRAAPRSWKTPGSHTSRLSGAAASRAMSDTSSPDLLEAAARVIPPLSGSNYKGQHGKVGVLGGCQEYTGAPYFAAMSALKVGADLAYVVCTEGAAPVIKSYSPELMVLPYLRVQSEDVKQSSALAQASASAILPWFSRMSVLVVGPGLGGDSVVVETTESLLKTAREQDLPCLVDGSALTHVIAHKPELVKGYRKCVLTPNIAELGRLANAVGVKVEGSIGNHWQQHAEEIAKALEGPILISKGESDVISDGVHTINCSLKSSPRRAGGQGDILAGTIATFISWTQTWRKQHPEVPLLQSSDGKDLPDLILAAYAGSVVTRHAASLAFSDAGRSMLATDVIQHLARAVENLEEYQQKKAD